MVRAGNEALVDGVHLPGPTTVAGASDHYLPAHPCQPLPLYGTVTSTAAKL